MYIFASDGGQAMYAVSERKTRRVVPSTQERDFGAAFALQDVPCRQTQSEPDAAERRGHDPMPSVCANEAGAGVRREPKNQDGLTNLLPRVPTSQLQ